MRRRPWLSSSRRWQPISGHQRTPAYPPGIRVRFCTRCCTPGLRGQFLAPQKPRQPMKLFRRPVRPTCQALRAVLGHPQSVRSHRLAAAASPVRVPRAARRARHPQRHRRRLVVEQLRRLNHPPLQLAADSVHRRHVLRSPTPIHQAAQPVNGAFTVGLPTLRARIHSHRQVQRGNAARCPRSGHQPDTAGALTATQRLTQTGIHRFRPPAHTAIPHRHSINQSVDNSVEPLLRGRQLAVYFYLSFHR